MEFSKVIKKRYLCKKYAVRVFLMLAIVMISGLLNQNAYAAEPTTAKQWSAAVKRAIAASPYDYFVIVGDSRTRHTGVYTQKDKNVTDHVLFVGTSGAEHYNLFRTSDGCMYSPLTGTKSNDWKRLNTALKKWSKKDGKIAVIFNYGVNELKYALRGGDCSLQQKKDDLKRDMLSNKMMNLKKKYHCDFFYSSINPVLPQKYRNNKTIRDFNRFIKSDLAPEYTYISTYGKLIGKDQCKYKDVTHYTKWTSYKILYYQIRGTKQNQSK